MAASVSRVSVIHFQVLALLSRLVDASRDPSLLVPFTHDTKRFGFGVVPPTKVYTCPSVRSFDSTSLTLFYSLLKYVRLLYSCLNETRVVDRRHFTPTLCTDLSGPRSLSVTRNFLGLRSWTRVDGLRSQMGVAPTF